MPLALQNQLGTPLVLALALLLAGCSASRPVHEPPRPEVAPTASAIAGVVEDIIASCSTARCGFDFARGVTVDSAAVEVDRVLVRFTDALAYRPLRPHSVDALHSLVGERLGALLDDRSLDLRVGSRSLDALIPNYYVSPDQRDPSRLAKIERRPAPLVQPLDRPHTPTAGLGGRYIALWPSHGWYYEQKLGRWTWQRARLFTSVEDVLPLSFIQPYLVPMLERAGATVFLARERDLQRHEVIVDQDHRTSGYDETGPWQQSGAGFAAAAPYSEGTNPFRLGSHRTVTTMPTETARAAWVPNIPEDGEYAVRVAYVQGPDRAQDATYTVHHAGGTTRFQINQQIGGGTWIHLGTFRFRAGQNQASGSVVLTNASTMPGSTVSADAVRFGGGMGNVVRGGATSGRPRWTEAARYHMQYAGMPDSLVYSLSGGENDYTDDYRGRGEWVNYLRGAPAGPNADRRATGLGIPIDLALAFHTDAGISRSDTTIGTLMIYSTDGADSTTAFPDGGDRLANRDFGDLLQTQITDDLRALYDPVWRRRSLWDRDYSEAVRPNVPSALLELLSHQSFRDMRFALDPRFRFDVSRAIYKAVLRFLSVQHGVEAIVQPLPVSHFQAKLTGTAGVTLRWQPTPDPLEPTADAEAYVVYTRREDGGWGHGRLVEANQVTFHDLELGVIYSYRIGAVNAGGESAPSETLAVLHLAQSRAPVLVVNGFDRVAPPAAFETDSLAGFAHWRDRGVPDRYDLARAGDQGTFDRSAAWSDNGDPGWGASYGDQEAVVVPGNTLDFPFVHGESLRAAGVSFASTSAAALAAGTVDTDPYRSIDLLLGEQKTTPWPKPTRLPEFEALPAQLRDQLTEFCARGGGLFVSGAYVGTDTFAGRSGDAPGPAFARTTLGIDWRTGHASQTGRVVSTGDALLPDGTAFSFVADFDPETYAVEAPDAVEPADAAGTTVLRYADTGYSAAVASRGSCPRVVFGFPFETIRGRADRDRVMAAVLRYLDTR